MDLSLSVKYHYQSMDARPILTLDTSAINKLADDSDSRALIGGLGSGFFVRLTFTNVEEVVATTCGDRRRKLLDVCRRLLPSGDCIDPTGEIIRKMVAGFERGARFDWQAVDVGFPEAEQEIARQENFPDDLAKVVREEARTYAKTFDKVYADARPNFDKVFVVGGKDRPANVSQLASGLKKEGQYWAIATNLYERVAERPCPSGGNASPLGAKCVG